MSATVQRRSGVATHAGRVREQNEDRYLLDNDRGVFAVIDGVGGHAAGERAAEIAARAIERTLREAPGDPREAVREAIAAANNEIFEQASSDPALQGMACVLTLAVIQDERVLIGHVGDSRLYLVWNGSLRKLTSDHSPVGEREERGELSEEEAMLHPRRHEVFRDVGSRPHTAADEDFIETKEFQLKPDAALLICSDGLTDLLPAAQIAEIVEGYGGDPDETARELVEAANAAGGTDNITAVFVAGPEFLGSGSLALLEARERHAVTRERPVAPDLARRIGRLATGRVAFLIYGLILGLWIALRLRS